MMQINQTKVPTVDLGDQQNLTFTLVYLKATSEQQAQFLFLL
jgi:hypothetical protein